MANGQSLYDMYKEQATDPVVPVLLNEIDMLKEQNLLNVRAAEERFAAGERRSVWLQRTLITSLLGLVTALVTILLQR